MTFEEIKRLKAQVECAQDVRRTTNGRAILLQYGEKYLSREGFYVPVKVIAVNSKSGETIGTVRN